MCWLRQLQSDASDSYTGFVLYACIFAVAC